MIRLLAAFQILCSLLWFFVQINSEVGSLLFGYLQFRAPMLWMFSVLSAGTWCLAGIGLWLYADFSRCLSIALYLLLALDSLIEMFQAFFNRSPSQLILLPGWQAWFMYGLFIFGISVGAIFILVKQKTLFQKKTT